MRSAQGVGFQILQQRARACRSGRSRPRRAAKPLCSLHFHVMFRTCRTRWTGAASFGHRADGAAVPHTSGNPIAPLAPGIVSRVVKPTTLSLLYYPFFAGMSSAKPNWSRRPGRAAGAAQRRTAAPQAAPGRMSFPFSQEFPREIAELGGGFAAAGLRKNADPGPPLEGPQQHNAAVFSEQ